MLRTCCFGVPAFLADAIRRPRSHDFFPTLSVRRHKAVDRCFSLASVQMGAFCWRPTAHYVHLLLLLSVACHQADALTFLFLPFMGGNSPSMDLMGVAAALQARGHSVTVVVTANGLSFAKRVAARHSSNTTAEAMQYLEFSMPHRFAARDEVGNLMKIGQQPGKYSSLMMLVGIQNMLARPCAALLQNTSAMQRIRALNVDAIMGIALPMPHSDSCGCVLSHLLGVPFIDINGHPMVDAPVTVPQFGAGITESDLHTVAGAAKNVLAYIMRNLVPMLVMDYGANPWVDLRKSSKLPRAASGCAVTNLLLRVRGQQLRRCSPLLEVFLSTFLMEPPRPLAAHQKLVGPGTPRPPHPIHPAEVAAFVEGASPHGLVLAAFGSTIQTVVLSHSDMMQLARGFAALAPTRVLWAMPEQGLPDGLRQADLPLGSNTMMTPWVDYNDVLGHPNTRAFVSHCGVHSVNEAAFHGVPVVAVPLQFEQAEHARRLASRGVGVISRQAPAYRKAAKDPSHFTAEGMQALMQEVMSNTSYAQTAQGVAAAMQRYAAQRQPYQRAADEIELAVMSAHAKVGIAPAASGTDVNTASTVRRAGFATASADQQGQELQQEDMQQQGEQQLGVHEEL